MKLLDLEETLHLSAQRLAMSFSSVSLLMLSLTQQLPSTPVVSVWSPCLSRGTDTGANYSCEDPPGKGWGAFWKHSTSLSLLNQYA